MALVSHLFEVTEAGPDRRKLTGPASLWVGRVTVFDGGRATPWNKSLILYTNSLSATCFSKIFFAERYRAGIY